MTCAEALYELHNLRLLRKVYTRLYQDELKSCYKDSELVKLLKMNQQEIDFLVELVHNMELDDSYDPNTGKLNDIYRNQQ